MATAAPELPVLARDQEFESLYRRYLKDVYHYALAVLRNPADAEDVTQTTFMNAYRALQRGEQVEKPHNWLIKIAHNAARSRYARASRRVKEVPLEDHVEQLAVPEDEKPDVHAVLEALGRLPLNQRAAIVMRELEGRTYAEIADTLNVSVPAVETLLFRARRALRLRASAIRALAAVPVPTSLAQWFETGGTAVLGGGALLGSGLLVKAAVAVVSGVVATGLAGGGNSHSAAAAAKAAPRVGSEHRLRTSALASAAVVGTRIASRDVVDSRGAAKIIKGDVVTARRGRPASEDTTSPATQGATAGPGVSQSSSEPASGGSSGPTTGASSTVPATTTSATSAVGSAVPAVPTPPTPSLPTVTVPPVPPPPPPPPLPSLP